MQNPRVFTAVRWSQGSTPRKYAAHDTYSSIFPVHKLRQTELTKDSPSRWRLWPLRPAVSCTRDGADWPKVVAVGAQQPISDFFGFIQMRDALSTNGEHLRVAEVKSFPAIPKLMRSVNGDQNGANLKKWSVLLVCTIQLCTENQCNQATLMAFYINFATEFFHRVFTRRSVLRWLGTVVTSHTAWNRQAYTPVMSHASKSCTKYSLHLVQSTSRHTHVIMLYAVKCSLYAVGQF